MEKPITDWKTWLLFQWSIFYFSILEFSPEKLYQGNLGGDSTLERATKNLKKFWTGEVEYCIQEISLRTGDSFRKIRQRTPITIWA